MTSKEGKDFLFLAGLLPCAHLETPANQYTSCGKTKPSSAGRFALNWRIVSAVLIVLLAVTSVATVYEYSQNQRLESRLTSITAERDRLARLALRNPTESDLLLFLAADHTNERSYRENEYVCAHFSRDLKANARMAGWNFSFILIYFTINFTETRIERRQIDQTTVLETHNIIVHTYAGSHAANAVYLSDESLVYIEPQSDQIYRNLPDLIWYLNLDPVDIFGNEDSDWKVDGIDITSQVIVW
jgi:hypothetical protein